MTDTPLQLIQETAGLFKEKGIPNPRLDAELLLARVLKCQRIDLYVKYEKRIPQKDLESFKRLVERRVLREPLQYILGETEFWGLKIRVTPDVLIPRPETELLVEEAIKIQKIKILEIGTGSGCISVALAKHLPNAKIIATEYSPEAMKVAEGNIRAHGLQERIKIILSDIAPWRGFKAEGRAFDLVISNPPYVPSGELSDLQAEVRDFEPRLALDGGPDGLSMIRKILDEVSEFLKPDGFLLMEIGENQAEGLKKEWRQYPAFKLLPFRKDYADVERILKAQKG